MVIIFGSPFARWFWRSCGMLSMANEASARMPDGLRPRTSPVVLCQIDLFSLLLPQTGESGRAAPG